MPEFATSSNNWRALSDSCSEPFFFALLLTGLVGHAAAEPLHWYEVFFCFGVAAMALWCLYYAWLNAYLFLTRNKAGQKRDMLESAADLQYRPR